MSVCVPMYTQSGEAHGLINVLTNSVVFDDFKHMQPNIKAKLEKEKKEDAELVEVEYINSRGRHERLDKHYCRYAGDRIEQWHLIPGYTYKVPYGMVKEVNGVVMPVRSGLVSLDGKDLNKNGAPLDRDMEGERLHRLVPISFSSRQFRAA